MYAGGCADSPSPDVPVRDGCGAEAPCLWEVAEESTQIQQSLSTSDPWTIHTPGIIRSKYL